VTNLSSNTPYNFRVAAENSSNNVISIYCDSITATTLPDPPSVPQPPFGVTLYQTLNPGDGQIQISWQPPTDNGGSTIISYNVQNSTDNSTWTFVYNILAINVISTGNTISGLTNGQMYYFQVAAVNSVGTGLYSSSSDPITIPMLPAPTGMSTGFPAEDGTITITWIAPTITTDMPAITDYYVLYSNDNSDNIDSWTRFIHTPSTDTTQILSNTLWVAYTTYYFKVAAVQTLSNADGSTILETGTYSASFTGSFSSDIPYVPPPP
jgi:titin